MAEDPWVKLGAPPLPDATPSSSTTSGSTTQATTTSSSTAPVTDGVSADDQSMYGGKRFGLGAYLPDWMMKPVAKVESPLDAARDYALATGDAATFGGIGHLVGKENVAQAHQNLGLMDYAAQGIGYGLGPGKILGPIAGKAVGLTGLGAEGAGLGERIGASMLAGGGEGAVAGGAGAYGHGEDVGTGALLGALGGAAGGAFGGMGPRPKAPDVGVPGGSSSPATGMYATMRDAYKPLDSIYFDRTLGVRAANQGAAFIRANRDPANLGANLGISPEAKSIVNNALNAPVLTARNLQEASRNLRDLDNGTNANAHVLADQFDSVLARGNPMPQSQVNGAAVAPGDAAGYKTQGDTWWGRIQDLNRLGTDPADLTKADIATTLAKQQQTNNPASSPAGVAALNTLTGAMKAPLNPWHLRHIVAPAAFEGAAYADQQLDPNDSVPWLRPVLHGLAGATLFSGLPAVLRPRPGPALQNARYAIATGKSPTPGVTGTVGNMLGDLLMGRAATGRENTQ